MSPCALSTLVLLTVASAADLPPPPPQAVHADQESTPHGVRRFAIIVIGLPGDEEHAESYRQLAQDWGDSLQTFGVSDQRLAVLSGASEDGRLLGASGENVREAVLLLADQIREDDALWVLFLGHGSYDGQHTWFHLQGPDLHEGDWADLFAPLECQEQVFWLTQSASGGFVRALSRPGRIVIAATEPAGEVNETRFPHVLYDVMQNVSPDMDANQDGLLSVLELFRATSAGVAAYYAANELSATEHAQLDDNGDGQGSEHVDESVADSQQSEDRPDQVALPIDGRLAAETFVTTMPAGEETAGGDE